MVNDLPEYVSTLSCMIIFILTHCCIYFCVAHKMLLAYIINVK